MEEGRAEEEALAPAPRGRRLARPVFYAAVALALLAFAVIVSGPEVSSALRRARLDREALLRSAEASGVYAVIAPNMAKQIVALQAALEQMARDFPGSFDGYALSVAESHQSTKADTSGTAKAMHAPTRFEPHAP